MKVGAGRGQIDQSEARRSPGLLCQGQGPGPAEQKQKIMVLLSPGAYRSRWHFQSR